jgi:hypothetical protein
MRRQAMNRRERSPRYHVCYLSAAEVARWYARIEAIYAARTQVVPPRIYLPEPIRQLAA